MLAEKDYDQLDMFLTFVVAIIDRCCGESSETSVTTMFTNYDVPMQELFRRNQRHG